ncbi:MAG TPA: uracil-DNA glycosylase [Nitrospiria bacterium]|jgi:uracil-DNA glycosylase family 4|nr:uracil-DNA glycosylase [Nitrospiria bacterium]
MADGFNHIHVEVVACTRCPRLRQYCGRIARVRRRAYRDQSYWGKPVPGFGDPQARLLIIGLAPAAHGGNRTGRIFTGDRSGDFLFSALYRAGFANQPESRRRDDGLELKDAYITAVLHCAPPGNKPAPIELDRCRDFLVQELRLLSRVQAVLTLGKIAFDQYLKTLIQIGRITQRRGIRFRHGVQYRLCESEFGPGPDLFASYHPSQQNTQTGRLTAPMLDQVLFEIRKGLSSTNP